MSKPLKTQAEVATERFNCIAPFLSDDLDKSRRSELMRKIAETGGPSERTLKRYLNAWREGGFEALKPKQGWERPDSKLGDNFELVVDAAIELRRESPKRSVADIIKILELEEAIPTGSVARSTLQRHLAARGYASSQMSMYTSKGAAARRFKKVHRCQLWHTDIKYSSFVPDIDGEKKQTYLIVWIDNATKYIVNAGAYFEQTENTVEDSLRLAIQKYGIPDSIFSDCGGQYRSGRLNSICAKLGIRKLSTKPYSPESNGLAENFNKQLNKFISEVAFKKPASLTEYNEMLLIWVEEYYHKNVHSGLNKISPATAFGTDKRPLKFVSAKQLRDAFLHTDSRKVDKTGCISFNGHPYEVGLAYIGRNVVIRFDPSWTDKIEIIHEDREPFIAKKLVIGTNCGVTRELPEHMRTTVPETSRMLDALKKQHQSKHRPSETVTSFKSLWEGGTGNV
jgi:transposase InsO family protein